MTDSHNRFLGNHALSPETLMMGYGYDPFLSERSLKPPVELSPNFGDDLMVQAAAVWD